MCWEEKVNRFKKRKKKMKLKKYTRLNILQLLRQLVILKLVEQKCITLMDQKVCTMDLKSCQKELLFDTE